MERGSHHCFHVLAAIRPSDDDRGCPAFCNRELRLSQPLLDGSIQPRHSLLRVPCDGSPARPAGSARGGKDVAFCGAASVLTAPAKGAMAIGSASLYWCGWHTR